MLKHFSLESSWVKFDEGVWAERICASRYVRRSERSDIGCLWVWETIHVESSLSTGMLADDKSRTVCEDDLTSYSSRIVIRGCRCLELAGGCKQATGVTTESGQIFVSSNAMTGVLR